VRHTGWIGGRIGEKADDIVTTAPIPSSFTHLRRHLLPLRRHWLLVIVLAILMLAAAKSPNTHRGCW
jgi:hypothetical protein